MENCSKEINLDITHKCTLQCKGCNRQDEDYLKYLKTMFEELDNNPMRWPILVIKKEHYWNRLPWRGTDEQYGVVTGSNRFLYALDRGYTHIESIICTDRSDWFPLWERTFRKTK